MSQYTTREEVEKLGIIDPELKQILDDASANGPAITAGDPRDVQANRKFMAMVEAQALKALGPPHEDIKETSSTIPMPDGHVNECKIVQPSNSTNGRKSPLIVFFFGGGYQMGSPDQLIPEARACTSLFNAVCICAGYRLAPEHPFPQPANDAWNTIQYIAANASTKYGADPASGFIVGGVSAGATLSAVATQLAKDNHLTPPLTGQWLSVPGFLDESTVPARYRDLFFSREQNANAPSFSKETRDALVAAHKPDMTSPFFSPINAPSGQTGLPSTYLQSCGLDPLRDDSLIYEKVLRDVDVKTKLDVYPGQPHGFWMTSPLKDKSRQARADTIKGIGWLLGIEVDNETARKPFQAL